MDFWQLTFVFRFSNQNPILPFTLTFSVRAIRKRHPYTYTSVPYISIHPSIERRWDYGEAIYMDFKRTNTLLYWYSIFSFTCSFYIVRWRLRFVHFPLMLKFSLPNAVTVNFSYYSILFEFGILVSSENTFSSVRFQAPQLVRARAKKWAQDCEE